MKQTNWAYWIAGQAGLSAVSGIPVAKTNRRERWPRPPIIPAGHARSDSPEDLGGYPWSRNSMQRRKVEVMRRVLDEKFVMAAGTVGHAHRQLTIPGTPQAAACN